MVTIKKENSTRLELIIEIESSKKQETTSTVEKSHQRLVGNRN